MFGLLALGFFASLAFSGLFGDKNGGKGGSNSEGGFGQKILGFLGVSKFSDIFTGNGNTATSSIKDDEKDEDKNNELNFNKSLALMQNQIDNAEGDKKDEALKTYNEMLGCMYDEEGNKLSQKEIQKKLDGNKKLKEKLEEQALIAAKDEKLAKQFKESADKITDAQANAAAENAVASHLENVKQQKLKDEKDDAKKAEINKKYDKMIAEHKAAAKKIEDIANVDADIKNLEKEKSELEEQNRKLSASDAAESEIKKCSEINWDDSSCVKGDLTGTDEEKKKAAEEFLESKGVNPELYKKYDAAEETLKDDEKIEDNEDLKNAAKEVVEKKKEELNNKIDEKEKAINTAKDKRTKIENGEKPEAEQNKGNDNKNGEGDNGGEQNNDNGEGDKGGEQNNDNGEGDKGGEQNNNDGLSDEDIEKLQNEIATLDVDKDKDEIKEKEDKLKNAAKKKGEDEKAYLIQTETKDGKQYQKKVGPKGGKYYRVKGDKGWGEWNSGTPPKSTDENLYIAKFLKGKMLNEHLVPKKTIQQYLKEQFA